VGNVERPDSERSAAAITQASTVRDVARLLRGTDPVTVRADDALRAVAMRSVAHPECGVLCVVDGEGRLVGLIPVTQLVQDIFVKIVPEEFLTHIDRAAQALDYAERLGARTAADIMGPPVGVRPDETVRDAFRKLHESELAGLPVVDDEGRVTGYLDELELLLAWVEASGRGRLLEPHGSGEGATPADPRP
jgi:CBS domain-containing protein